MSLWTRISDALAALANGESLSQVFNTLRSAPERSVGFTIAVIALGAKMAKADGQVTRDEVTAFREVFNIAEEDEANAAKVFNMARLDVAGYEEYAARIADMFEGEKGTLCDLMRGCFTSRWRTGFTIRARMSFCSKSQAFLAFLTPNFALCARGLYRMQRRILTQF